MAKSSISDWQKSIIIQRIGEYRMAKNRSPKKYGVEDFFKIPVGALVNFSQAQILALSDDLTELVYLIFRAEKATSCHKGIFSKEGLINKLIAYQEIEGKERVYDVIIEKEFVVKGTKTTMDKKICQIGHISNADRFQLPLDKRKIVLIHGFSSSYGETYSKIYFQ